MALDSGGYDGGGGGDSLEQEIVDSDGREMDMSGGDMGPENSVLVSCEGSGVSDVTCPLQTLSLMLHILTGFLFIDSVLFIFLQ